MFCPQYQPLRPIGIVLQSLCEYSWRHLVWDDRDEHTALIDYLHESSSPTGPGHDSAWRNDEGIGIYLTDLDTWWSNTKWWVCGKDPLTHFKSRDSPHRACSRIINFGVMPHPIKEYTEVILRNRITYPVRSIPTTNQKETFKRLAHPIHLWRPSLFQAIALCAIDQPIRRSTICQNARVCACNPYSQNPIRHTTDTNVR